MPELTQDFINHETREFTRKADAVNRQGRQGRQEDMNHGDAEDTEKNKRYNSREFAT